MLSVLGIVLTIVQEILLRRSIRDLRERQYLEYSQRNYEIGRELRRHLSDYARELEGLARLESARTTERVQAHQAVRQRSDIVNDSVISADNELRNWNNRSYVEPR